MVKPSNLKQGTYWTLKNRIIWGEIPQGTPLREVPLSKELNVSRTPVREAIAQLVQDGLAVYTPGSGAVVKKFEAQDIRDLYELREQLELFSLKKAVQFVSEESILKMRECCDNFRRLSQLALAAKTNEELLELSQENCATDLNFHLQIILNSRNRYVRKITSDLNVMGNIITLGLHLGIRDGRDLSKKLEEAYERHGEILQAIIAKDCDRVCGLVSEHLQSACERIMNNLNQSKSAAKRDWSGDVGKTLQLISEVG